MPEGDDEAHQYLQSSSVEVNVTISIINQRMIEQSMIDSAVKLIGQILNKNLEFYITNSSKNELQELNQQTFNVIGQMKKLLKHGLMPGVVREYIQESIYLKISRDFGTNIEKDALGNKIETALIKQKTFSKPESLSYIDSLEVGLEDVISNDERRILADVNSSMIYDLELEFWRFNVFRFL